MVIGKTVPVRLLCAPAILMATLAVTPCATLAQNVEKPRVTVVGRFTNMRFTEEHAYGYAVELWRHEKSLIGLFLCSEGLAGDTPAGQIENIEFNAKTGAMSFQARLSTGVVYSKEHDGVPSRDLFRFTGMLRGMRLRGRLERFDLLNPHAAPTAEQVALRREKSQSDMTAYKSLSDWKVAADEILNFRGPKW